jgi:arginine:ornithine antiporter / lysine permease
MSMNKMASKTTSQSFAQLKLGMLIALVVGSIIGSGIFNLPQNMAANAGGAAIIVGWIITGFGMLMLCFVYQTLAIQKPTLNNGIYAYARASAGEFVGFNSAWGYWISACLGNVSYLIAIFAALGYFFPILDEGNTPTAILCASIILWTMHGFILHGIKGAALLNAIITLAKIIPLLLFIVLTLLAFQLNTFKINFWGPPELGSFIEQVKNTMLVTVWVFIGIEGASVYSAHAKDRADIGKATLIGFMITLLLLLSISLLSLGIVSQTELAHFTHLSMAGILQKIVGSTGGLIMVLGFLLSVGGALLSWTLLAAEALFTPAKEGLMPHFLGNENHHEVPTSALWATNGVIQLFLMIVIFSKATYITLISLTTSMILIPYLFSAIYALKINLMGESDIKQTLQQKQIIISLLATIYCCWLLYAAGIKYLLLSLLLYVPGVFFYIVTKYQQGKRVFQPFEKIILIVIISLTVMTIYLLKINKLTF